MYLDISFAFDPEVVFPLFIVPSRIGAPSCSDFPAPAVPTGPYPVPAGPAAYGYPASDPTQHANTASGYNNQWPQPVAPYAFPPAAFPPPAVQHPPPTAPPLFQEEEPPAYMSLFPPSHGTFGSTESDHKI